MDWAENYAILLSVFNLSKDDIKKSTIPFLNGLKDKLPVVLELKRRLSGGDNRCPLLGIGMTSEGAQQQPQERYKEADEAPTRSQIESFFGG